MDMKKYLLLLFILLLTGCKATYNLNISDDKIIESSNFYRESSDPDYYVDEDGFKIEDELFNLNDMLDSYYNNDYYAFNYNFGSDAFYTKRKIDDINGIGINLSYSYNYDNFQNSYLFSYCFSNDSFVNNDNYIVIDAKDFGAISLLDQSDQFDSLVINIKTNLKVVDNNADYVKGNVYSWTVDRSNINSKRIYIKIKKKVDYTNLFIFIGFVIIFALFILLFSLYVIRNNRKNNEI